MAEIDKFIKTIKSKIRFLTFMSDETRDNCNKKNQERLRDN